jgi:phage terminase large subunit-like protein
VQQATRAIDLRVWDENHMHPLEARVDSRAWYGGLDLGGTSDLSAWVRVSTCPHDPDAVDVRAQFWLPEAIVGPESRHKNKTLYRQWADQGLLTLTPGNIADEAAIQAAVLADAQAVRLVSSRIDKLFQGQRLGSELTAEGVEMAGMGQGYEAMTAPTRKVLELVAARRLHHGGDPILRWMADNAVLAQHSAGGLKFDKARSPQKIDGLIALTMAVSAWLVPDTEPDYQVFIVGGPGAHA